jgi:hypothetical protein
MITDIPGSTQPRRNHVQNGRPMRLANKPLISGIAKNNNAKGARGIAEYYCLFLAIAQRNNTISAVGKGYNVLPPGWLVKLLLTPEYFKHH